MLIVKCLMFYINVIAIGLKQRADISTDQDILAEFL
jgi:hypothetical protein